MCTWRTWDTARRGSYVWIDDTRNVILPTFLICAWPDAQPVRPETGTRPPGHSFRPVASSFLGAVWHGGVLVSCYRLF